MGGPSHLGLLSQICRPYRLWGRAPLPLTERRMVLYATRPKTLNPADPCNKVPPNTCTRWFYG